MTDTSLLMRLMKKMKLLFSYDALIRETKLELDRIEDDASLLFVNLLTQLKSTRPHLTERLQQIDAPFEDEFKNQPYIKKKLIDLRDVIASTSQGLNSSVDKNCIMSLEKIDKAVLDLELAFKNYQDVIAPFLSQQTEEASISSPDPMMDALLEQQHKMEALHNQIYVFRDKVITRLEHNNFAQLANQLEKRMLGIPSKEIISLLYEELSRRSQQDRSLKGLFEESERLLRATNIEQEIINAYCKPQQ